jgi:putative ATP-dependent endonuclease of the OLD family
MKIEQITLRNFRSFGPDPEVVRLSDGTTLIGANGSGKSNALMALVRMFGVTPQERTLEPGDVHVPHGKRLEDLGPVTVTIEAKIALPEIKDAPQTVAGVFNQMIVPAPGADPFCRIRLEGKWSGGAADDGEMDVSLAWIATTDDPPKPENVYRVAAVDRARIQAHYVPAARDPARQLRIVSTALLARLFRGVEFSPKVTDLLKKTSDDVREAFQGELGIKSVTAEVEQAWQALNDAPNFSRIGFRPFEAELDDLLRRVEMVLGPAPHTSEVGVERLSDGQKSLFYLSLIAAVFAVEDHVRAGKADKLGLAASRLTPPMLTLLAVEEPENHLAPHYLARIMETLNKVASSTRGQVLLTSHSPAILGRVEPEAVRHLRLESASGRSSVKEIALPDKKNEAHVYVREAVLAHPELYFARLVVLGEGDSEMILVPRLARSRGTLLDRSFVSVVPLGGRHVNHFWKLLRDLEIPHVTLLDLDRERIGGGWGRVHYALTQLLERGVKREELLALKDGKVLADKDLEAMPDWKLDATLDAWLARLEQYDVFFSAPLDVDFMMLRAFPKAYHATAPPRGGPRLPSDAKELKARIERATEVVLKAEGGDGSTYDKDEKNEFPWYANLFLGRGKPTTHLLALAALKDDELKAGMPKPLERLLARIEEKLK